LSRGSRSTHSLGPTCHAHMSVVSDATDTTVEGRRSADGQRAIRLCRTRDYKKMKTAQFLWFSTN
jgi:hypothetical protein